MILLWLACGPASPLIAAGTVDADSLDELSGLVSATTFEGFWAIEDSGNPASLVALDLAGHRIGTVPLDAPNRDWEDLARDAEHLYVADIGDNLGVRAAVTVHRLREPAIGDAHVVVTPITLTWPERPRNAEALVVAAGQIFVFSKSPTGDTRVCRAPATPGEHALVEVARLTVGEGALAGNRQVTAASYDGATLVLRSYDHAWAWPVTDGDVVRALTAVPTPLPLAKERAGEAIAVVGRQYWTVSEGRHPTLWRGALP